MATMWDLYTNNSNTDNSSSDWLDSLGSSSSDDSSWSVDGITSTANSWIDSLGNTFLKYTEMKTAYDNTKSSTQNEAAAKQYDNIQQQTAAAATSQNKNYLIYGGVALIGAYFIFGGK